MKCGIERYLLLFVLGTCLSASSDDYLQLDDCEGEMKWTSNVGEVLKVDDASQGKSAVGIRVERPLETELRFNLKSCNVDLSKYDLVAFDYKLTGPVEIVDFIIRQFPLNAGRRGNYYPIDQADPRGVWATKILPLRGPENLLIYLNQFDPEANELLFKFTPTPGMVKAVLLVDNLRVMKNILDIRPVTFGEWYRQGNGDIIWQYSIPVKNVTDKTVEAIVTSDASGLKKFKVNPFPSSIFVKPRAIGHINVSITIPGSEVNVLQVFYGEEIRVKIAPVGSQAEISTRLIAAVPPKSFVHPSLIGSIEQIKNIEKRAQGDKVLAPIWAGILKSAEDSIKNPLAVPDFNGAGISTCDVDSTKLKPIKREDLNFTEYLCPKCGRVYHGKLYDSEFSGAGGWNGIHMKLGASLLNCALAYRVTGNKEFGCRARDIIKGYTEKYLTYDMLFPNDGHYPLGPESPSSRRICGWHFMENLWIQNLAIAYDILLGTEVLSEKDGGDFKEKVLRPAVQKTTENEVGLNNIQLPHSLAQICAGFALEDPVLVYYGSMEKRGIMSNIAHNILEDGTWPESLNYNSYVAGLLPPCLYLLKRVGCDPYTEKVIKFFYRPVQMANPAGLQPNFGDGSGGDVGIWGSHALLPYCDTKNSELVKIIGRYPDRPLRGLSQLFYLMAYDASIKTISGTVAEKCESVTFPGIGFLFLNNDANNLWFAMVYGGQIGHGHYDRLGFELFGGGALQSIDDGAGPYDQYHDEFNMRTLAHNTIVVDMKNQNPGSGKILEWRVDGKIKIATVASEQLYDGVAIERSAIMFPGAVLLLDNVSSDKEHTYDWAYHNKGEIVSGLKFFKAEPLASQGMYSYLKDLKRIEVQGENVKIEFRQRKIEEKNEGSGLQLTQISGSDNTLFSALTAHGYKQRFQCATLISRRKAKDSNFITLLEPIGVGKMPAYELCVDGKNIIVSGRGDKWIVSKANHIVRIEELKHE